MTEAATLRRCIGSARFGIEAHEAPIGEFPHQPSQKDGLGRLCREHWRAYTAGLARDAKARKAAEAGDAEITTTEIYTGYNTLSLHDALPILQGGFGR